MLCSVFLHKYFYRFYKLIQTEVSKLSVFYRSAADALLLSSFDTGD